jgi:hypothetical protein
MLKVLEGDRTKFRLNTTINLNGTLVKYPLMTIFNVYKDEVGNILFFHGKFLDPSLNVFYFIITVHLNGNEIKNINTEKEAISMLKKYSYRIGVFNRDTEIDKYYEKMNSILEKYNNEVSR